MSEQAVEEEKQISDTNNNENEASPGSGMPQDGQICRDYQRGVCNRGGKCKFSHPDGLGKEIESGPMICRDFQNGKCNRSTCKYLHISNTEEKVYLRTGQLPMRRPPMPTRGLAFGYPTRANRGDPVCKDFLNNKCTRGSACKFRHSFEDEKGGYGPPGYGYDDYPRKRRRDSYGDGDYGHLKEENESLRRQVSDLQKQVSDLKATNEVLLEQNARYRNQASSSTAYPSTPSYGTTSYAAKTPTAAAVAAPTNYASSYLTAYNGNTTATTYTTVSSYTTNNPSYTTTSYGATSSNSTTYSSSYPSGTGYMKFE